MKRTACLLGLVLGILVLAGSIASAGALCVPMIDQAQIDRHLSKLAQISTDVSAFSQGKERLLIDPGISPWPTVGQRQSVRDVQGLQAIYGFMSVFPVSSPVQTELAGIGEGKILGAVSITVSASAPGDNKAEPGVYMLFLPTAKGPTSGPLQVLWISRAEDADGKVIYKEVMRSPAGAASSPSTETTSPNTFRSVSASIDVVDAQVEMRWKTEGYKMLFKLGLSWA